MTLARQDTGCRIMMYSEASQKTSKAAITRITIYPDNTITDGISYMTEQIRHIIQLPGI